MQNIFISNKTSVYFYILEEKKKEKKNPQNLAQISDKTVDLISLCDLRKSFLDARIKQLF